MRLFPRHKSENKEKLDGVHGVAEQLHQQDGLGHPPPTTPPTGQAGFMPAEDQGMDTTPPSGSKGSPSEYASAKSTLSPGMRGFEPSAKGFTRADINLSTEELLARMNAHLAGRKRDKESAAARGRGGGLPMGPQRPQPQHCQPPPQQQQQQQQPQPPPQQQQQQHQQPQLPKQQQQQHQQPSQPQSGPSGTPRNAGHGKPATFKLTPPSRHSKPGKPPKKESEKKRQTRQSAKAAKSESASGWETDSSTTSSRTSKSSKRERSPGERPKKSGKKKDDKPSPAASK